MSYQILMNSNKMLIATNKINLYKGENLVDKIEFIIPFKYSDKFDLREFTPTLVYLDTTNETHIEPLTYDEELYKEDYLKAYLDVDSKLSKIAGDVELGLSFVKNDYDLGKAYVLKTNTITVPIDTVQDYYSSISKDGLEEVTKLISDLDSKIDMLNTVAETLDASKADNIEIGTVGDDPDKEYLYLTAKGDVIGNPIDLDELGSDISEFDTQGLVRIVL